VSAELALLRDELTALNVDGSTLDLWYKKDSNAVPPVSVLQPISSILVNFNNKVYSQIKSAKKLFVPASLYFFMLRDGKSKMCCALLKFIRNLHASIVFLVFKLLGIVKTLAGSKAATTRPGHLVGHDGENAKAFAKSVSLAVQQRKNRQRNHAQLFHVR